MISIFDTLQNVLEFDQDMFRCFNAIKTQAKVWSIFNSDAAGNWRSFVLDDKNKKNKN
jgi:hypothetical protein